MNNKTSNYYKAKLYNILDDQIVEILKENEVFIAGGTVRSLVCNESIKDIDIYFRSPESALATVNALKGLATIVHVSNKSITFYRNAGRNSNQLKEDTLIIQCIFFNYFTTSLDIFKSFDFSCCMGAFDFKNESFEFDDQFFTDNCSKTLSVNSKTTFPIMSVFRVEKYREYGYKIAKTELLKLLFSISSLKLESWDDIKAHVGGMYGTKIEKIFNVEVPFSKETLVDQLSNINTNELVKNDDAPLEIPDDIVLINLISGKKIPIFMTNETAGYVNINGLIKSMSFDDQYFEKTSDPYLIFPRYFYKFVNLTNGRLFSRYERTFEYLIGGITIDKTGHGLYFTTLEKVHLNRNSGPTEVLIKLEIPDFTKLRNSYYQEHTCTEVRVVEVISNKEEIDRLVKSKSEDNELF